MAKKRDLNREDVRIIRERLVPLRGGGHPKYNSTRDEIARERGLTMHQISAAALHMLNGDKMKCE